MMKIFLCLLLFPLLTFAFDLDDWRTITNMNDINGLASDEEYLWAATTGGVFRYEITSGEITKFTNIEGMRSVYMETIAIDESGMIITAGKSGIIEFYSPAGDLWQQSFKLQDNNVRDMVVQNDSLWVAAGKGVGLFLWDGSRYIFYDYYYNFPVRITDAISIELYNNRIWLGSENGLLSAPSDVSRHTINNPEEWIVYSSPDGLPSNRISALNTMRDTLWVGTSAGLAAVTLDMDVEKMTNWGEGSQFGVDAISRNDSHLLIASGKELFRYSAIAGKTPIKRFDRAINAVLGLKDLEYAASIDNDGFYLSSINFQIKIDGPDQNITRYVIKDQQGRIWTSSSKFLKSTKKGFSLKTNDHWINTKFNTSRWADIGNSVRLYEDSYENIWIGSWGGGMMSFLANGDTVYFHGHDFAGKIQISTYQSYEEIDQTDARRYHEFLSGAPVNLENYEVISAIRQDHNNRLWIGNYWAGSRYQLIGAPYTNDNFISLDKDDWAYFQITTASNDENSAISCLEIDQFGRVWCGTLEDGIYILDHNNTLYTKGDDRIYHLSEADGLYANSIRSLAVDNDGVVWIGTTSGLNSHDGVNVYKHVGDEEGVSGPLDNQINFIFIDKYNNRWFATPAGVSILRADHSPWDPDAWIGYTTQNSGLLSNNAHCIYVDDKTGEALIATEDGLSATTGRYAQIRPDYNQVSGGPNPFMLNGPYPNFTITNLKINSTIKIYSINGKLVRELSSDNGYVDGSRAVWDGRDDTGSQVSTGIYLFTAFDQEGESTAGKIAVIRK